MRILDLSIIRQLLVGLIFVAGGLTVVVWLSQSLRFVEMIVNNGATPMMFIQLTGLLIPNLLIITLPIALFIVTMFMFSKMTTDRELVVMGAAGLSPLQVARPALVVAGITTFACYILSLYLVPQSYRMFEDLKTYIRYDYSQLLIEAGEFNSIGDDITVYVREKTPDNALTGIFIHDQRDRQKAATVIAKRGTLVQADDGGRLVLFDGNRQVLDEATGKYNVLFFDRYSFGLDNLKKENAGRARDPREMSVVDLLDVKNQVDIPLHDHDRYIVAGHKRMIAPLMPIGGVAIAMVFLCTGGFSRRNQTKRVMAAVVVFVAAQVLTLGAESVSARNLTLTPLLYISIVTPILVGGYLLLRPPRMRYLN